MSEPVLIKNTTMSRPPSLPFRLIEEIKESVLGSRYELSVVFVGRRRIQTLNRIYRRKNRATDILSFPLAGNSGEIFICSEQAIRMAKKNRRAPDDYLAFLFIHGLLHLKGLAHGSRMESEEKTIASRFGIDAGN